MSYGPKPIPIEERFWKHVTRGGENECWEWRGALAGGYGIIFASNKPVRFAKAHRLSWEIHNGPIPQGRHVLHRCDNPPCVNPAHLYVGTQADNARDRTDRKRGKENRQRGESNDNAKLTDDQVRAIIVELQRVPRRSQASIAADFGVKQQQISRIMHRKQWRHLWEE